MSAIMNESAQGYLSEVFISHQGEGPWLGRRQLFIRLAGCSRGCRFCDTPLARNPSPEHWRLYAIPASSRFRRLPNPISIHRLVTILRPMLAGHGPIHSVTLTGGEPLEQPGFTYALGIALKKNSKETQLMLETNGLCDTIEQYNTKAFDFISLDFKLESATGQKASWRQYQSVLQSYSQKQGCVKVVVMPVTTPSEITIAARLAFRCKPDWAFIIQPATGPAWKHPARSKRLDALSCAALAVHPRTRLIPQMHRLLGLA